MGDPGTLQEPLPDSAWLRMPQPAPGRLVFLALMANRASETGQLGGQEKVG